MSDIEMIKSQIQGLSMRLQQLESHQRLFIKAQGIDEAEAGARKDNSNHEVDLQESKEKLAELLAKKRDAVKTSVDSLTSKMNEILPTGKAIFEIEDSGIFIGWQRPDKKRVPYAGLSGGQKVPFDQALCAALVGDAKLKVLIFEAAEADENNLNALIEKLTAAPDDTQVIVNSWFMPEKVPDSWNVVRFQ